MVQPLSQTTPTNTIDTHPILNFVITLNLLIHNKTSTTPIAPLQPDNGEVAILFVAFNAIQMYARSEDPVFGAREYFLAENGEPVYIMTDRYVSPIACNDRYWICDPNMDEAEGACTAPVDAYRVLTSAYNGLDLNVFQLATVQRLALLVPHLGMCELVWTRSGNALRAQDTLAGLDQSPLADNHLGN